MRGDLIGRAVRLIKDGLLEREGVPGLAERLGYSTRQLLRQMSAELGTGPLALARAQRAETSRILLESTILQASQIAFAAGFTSVRQFNDTVREVYGLTPSEIRNRGGLALAERDSSTTINLRLSYREPNDPQLLFEFLARRAVPGLEEYEDGCYRRVLNLPHAVGILSVRAGESLGISGYLRAELTLADLRDLSAAVARCRRLFDLDADPVAIDQALGADELLAPMVLLSSGDVAFPAMSMARSSRCALLGQQVSVSAARTQTARLVRGYGSPLASSSGSLTHAFPVLRHFLALIRRTSQCPRHARLRSTPLTRPS